MGAFLALASANLIAARSFLVARPRPIFSTTRKTIAALLALAILAGCASDPSIPFAHSAAGICPSGTLLRQRGEVPICEVLPRLERAVRR